MYYTLTPWGLHVPLLLVDQWTEALHSGGTMGVLLQSNTPFLSSSAYVLGFIQDGWRILNVAIASGGNLHHRRSGNFGQSVDFSSAFALYIHVDARRSSIFLA